MSNRRVVEQYFEILMGCVVSGDFRPIGDLFAEDAQMLPGDGRVLRGKEAIAAFFQRPAPGFWVKPLRMTESDDDVRVAYEVGWLGLEEPIQGVDTFTVVGGKITMLRVGSPD